MVLLISRAEEYSPNNVGKDRAVLDAVCRELTGAGQEVKVVREEDATSAMIEGASLVMSMARRWQTLMMIERSGCRCLNRPQSVRTVAHSREMTLELMQSAGVEVPPFWGYEPSDDDSFMCDANLQQLLPGWIKGMHRRGVTSRDVRFIDNPIEADTAVLTMAAEGYSDIVVTKHLEGCVLKCYCVADADGNVVWSGSFLPQTEGYTKFGDEAHNTYSESAVMPGEEALQDVATRIARVLRLRYFGFDAIIGKDGNISVIDVNDWPSYSRYRDVAARAIACDALKNELKK
ncbi:MAG: hypothetical protein KBT20_03600 [Bacteroidales bacterium]|nr:hypothetical protein [Candidatus Liminaster caballi]